MTGQPRGAVEGRSCEEEPERILLRRQAPGGCSWAPAAGLGDLEGGIGRAGPSLWRQTWAWRQSLLGHEAFGELWQVSGETMGGCRIGGLKPG